METIARNTPQLTQATPGSTASAGLGGRCATFTLRALRAMGKTYMEGARCNPYWIGACWLPGSTTSSRGDRR